MPAGVLHVIFMGIAQSKVAVVQPDLVVVVQPQLAVVAQVRDAAASSGCYAALSNPTAA
jgi:hypothetical protein